MKTILTFLAGRTGDTRHAEKLLRTGFACGLLALGPHSAASDGPLITIEDLLGSEDVGDAWFSPNGERLAFMHHEAASARPTAGFDDVSFTSGRIYAVHRGRGSPHALAGLPGARYRLAGRAAWSPDGDGLVVMQALDGEIGYAYWDMPTGQVRPLPGRPDLQFSIYHPPVFEWAGKHLVYPALAEGGHQTVSNSQTLERAGRAWRSAWSRPDPQVTVSSANPALQTSRPLPGRLMLADPRRGTAKEIAEGDYVSVIASADGGWFAAVRLAEDLPASLNWQDRRGELQIYRVTDAGAELAARFEDLDVEYRTPVWAPSENRLLVAGKHRDEDRRRARLFEFRASDRSMSGFALPSTLSLSADTGGADMLPLGWVGGSPAAILARRSAAAQKPAVAGTRLDYGAADGQRLDLHVFAGADPQNLTGFAATSVEGFMAPGGADSALVVADGALWRVGVGLPPARLSPVGEVQVAGFAVDRRFPEPSPASAYRRTESGERIALHVLGPDGRLRRDVLDIRDRRFEGVSAEGDFLAAAPDLGSTVWKIRDGWSTRLVLRDHRGDVPLMTVNAGIRDRAVAPVRRFAYSSAGKDLEGWVITPPGAAPDAALPAVLFVYGGAVWAEQPFLSGADPRLGADSGQLLAAQGYAVIYPSLPLEAGADSNVMAALAEHAVAAVDALAAQGVVDPARVGLIGQSFGGFSVAAILAERSDRFRAGVSLAGIYDWISAYGAPSQVQLLDHDGRIRMAEVKMVESGQIRLERPFWEDPSPYIRNSPIFHVRKMDAPLLMLHGDLDFGVSGLSGAIRMYNALVRAGKQPALIRYWGEGHVLGSAWAAKDQWLRVSSWFERYVKR